MPGLKTSQTTTSFLGTRWRLFFILLSGYLLMLLTFGVYRFWLVTDKRRFYWAHTQIHGEGLEYTGKAMQLLVGFLLALAIFLPLYGFFFYLSTQSPEAATLGYLGAGVFMFFLTGYASYRGRRFLLSRTLWRSIRFSQGGSAWAYAIRRFLWICLTILTLGLAYPFMVASLWKYRYNHTWFGDRKCEFNGSWRSIAGPYYVLYFMFVGLLVAGLYLIGQTTHGQAITADNLGENLMALSMFGGAGFILFIAYFYLRARITSRMLSSVSIGKARLAVRVRARSLFWQQLAYTILISIVAIVFLLLLGFILGDILDPLMQKDQTNLSEVLKLGWYNLVILGLVYLSFMACLSLLAELVFGFGFWRLVARGTIIENETDLRTVRARGEESALTGEGIADALNVGAY